MADFMKTLNRRAKHQKDRRLGTKRRKVTMSDEVFQRVREAANAAELNFGEVIEELVLAHIPPDLPPAPEGPAVRRTGRPKTEKPKPIEDDLAGEL